MSTWNPDLRWLARADRSEPTPLQFGKQVPMPQAGAIDPSVPGPVQVFAPNAKGQAFLQQFQQENPGLPTISIKPISGQTNGMVQSYFSPSQPNTIHVNTADSTINTLAHEAEHLKRFNANPQGSPFAVFGATFKADPEATRQRDFGWSSDYGSDLQSAMKSGFLGSKMGMNGKPLAEAQLYGYPMVEEESAAQRAGQKALEQFGTSQALNSYNKDAWTYMYPSTYGGMQAGDAFYLNKLNLNPIMQSVATPGSDSRDPAMMTPIQPPPQTALKLALEAEPVIQNEVVPGTKSLIESYLGPWQR